MTKYKHRGNKTGNTNGLHTHEKMLNVNQNKKNANQSYI